MKINKLEPSKLRELLRDRIFSVTFKKRSDGSIRNIVGRLDVKKHVIGRGASYNASDYGLLIVFELKTNSYKCIPIDGIIDLKCGEISFKISDD